MKALQKLADLDEAKSQGRAIIFLWVDWSIQARQSEIAVSELLELWQTAHGDCPMIAYRIDLSSQEGEMWRELRAWLKNEGKPLDRLTYGGYRAVLWLRLGRVVLSLAYAAMPNAGYERLKKLEALTAGAFA
jgi:hypothetical protein